MQLSRMAYGSNRGVKKKAPRFEALLSRKVGKAKQAREDLLEIKLYPKSQAKLQKKREARAESPRLLEKKQTGFPPAPFPSWVRTPKAGAAEPE